MPKRAVDIQKHIENAGKYYLENVPYRDVAHMHRSIESADELLDMHRRHLYTDQPELRESVLLGVAYHGANSHHPHQTFNYDTKQAYAAAIAEANLIEEADPDLLTSIQENIRATNPHTINRRTLSQVITNQAIGGYFASRDYGEFKEWAQTEWSNSEKSWEEYRTFAVGIGRAAVARTRQELIRVGAFQHEIEQWLVRQERNLLLLSNDDNVRVIT